MNPYTRTFLSAAILAALPGAALSADMDLPIFTDQAPDYVPVEVGNGWYLRGDIGYAFERDTGPAVYRVYDPVTGLYSDNLFATSDIDEDFVFGVGFGYQFNEWFRADATIEHFNGDFEGTTATALPCAGLPAGTLCRSDVSGDFYAYSMMVNAYADMGTFNKFTPYLGAGLGYTYVNWSDVGETVYCVDGAVGCGGAFVADITYGGLDSYRFTYALMAGLAYDISRNLKLDLGYKYRHIDGDEMYGFSGAELASGASGAKGFDDDLESHEISLGIRYSLW